MGVDGQRSARWLAVAGALSLGAGLIAFLYPAALSVAIAVFIGWFLLIGGVAQLIGAFSGGGTGLVVLRLLLAVVSAAAGFWLITEPVSGTVTLTVILIWYFLAFGMLQLVAYFGNRELPGGPLVALTGAVQIVLAVLIWRHLPSSADWAIGLLVGIQFAFQGITYLMLAARARRDPPGPPAPAA